MEMTKEERFGIACEKVIGKHARQNDRVGTLGEKTLHAVLKHYLEPDAEKHEIKCGSYFADVLNDGGIFEIQTRNFGKLRPKLDYFLEFSDVTIVHPIPKLKYVCWVNGETGEIAEKRKSPKKGNLCDLYREMVGLKNYIGHPRLHFLFLELELVEYKLLDGWSRDKKKGSTKIDRIPSALLGEIRLSAKEDFRMMIPEGLPERFMTKDFKKKAHASDKGASAGISLLKNLGFIRQVGKEGRAYLYEVVNSDENYRTE